MTTSDKKRGRGIYFEYNWAQCDCVTACVGCDMLTGCEDCESHFAMNALYSTEYTTLSMLQKNARREGKSMTSVFI